MIFLISLAAVRAHLDWTYTHGAVSETTTTTTTTSVAILAQAATVVHDFLCQLVSVCGTSINVVPCVLSFVWVSGADSGTRHPNSVQDPGKPSLLESHVEEDRMEETCLPSRRLLTPRLGGGSAQFLKSFMWPCHRALILCCFRVRLLLAALSVTVGCHAATAGFVPGWAAVFRDLRML